MISEILLSTSAQQTYDIKLHLLAYISTCYFKESLNMNITAKVYDFYALVSTA